MGIKKRGIVIGIFFILILLSGCKKEAIGEDFEVFKANDEKQVLELIEEKCSIVEDSGEKIGCKQDVIIKEAVSFDNVDICDLIEKDDVKEVCINGFFMNKAVSENNAGFCDNILNENLKEVCKSSFR